MSELALMAAMDQNRVIGNERGILWHLPVDFQHFKETTMGHPMMMGRTTFESLPGILPGRAHIVLSRDTTYSPKDVLVAHTIDDALQMAFERDDKPFVIGGGQIYDLFMDKVTRMYLTHVHTAVPRTEGMVYFPEININDWKEVSWKDKRPDENHKHYFEMAEYERVIS